MNTSAAKREETRKRNAAARKEKDKAAREERELIRSNLLQVLKSADATPAERLESAKLLAELNR